jgi:hypothetical protein
LNERLPVFTRGRDTNDIVARDITLLTLSDLNKADLLLLHDGDEYTFDKGDDVGENKSFIMRKQNIPMSDWQIKILDIQKVIEKVWLVVRYILE